MLKKVLSLGILSRKARVIKELTGEVEIYAPLEDPSSVMNFPQVNQKFGVPIILDRFDIELTPYDNTSYQKTLKEQNAPSN